MAVLPTVLKAFPLSLDSSSWLATRDSGPDATAFRAAAPVPPRRRMASMVSIAECRASPANFGDTSAKSGTLPCSLGAVFRGSEQAVPSEAASSPAALASAELSSALLRVAAHAARTFGNSFEAMKETWAPPCPSKTANNACVVSGVGSDATMQVASSIAGRQPCISLDAHSISEVFPPPVFFCRRGIRSGPEVALSTRGCATLAMTINTVTVITAFRV
mmetsp:Transcript_128314/g.256279  ORF Transcript_128314/g.256279 Transcript_128314/m.256279 type:complete len:219 (-) Transcript_128314:57-713(-)